MTNAAGSPDVRKQRKVRVLVVDDHPMIRELIRVVCEGSARIEIVGEAANGAEALELARSLHPDVVVLDVGLPGIDGLEVAARIKAEQAETRILILSDESDPQTIFQCRRIGVEGFFDKTESVEDVVEAIEAVGDGERMFTTQQERTAHDQLASLVRKIREAYQVASSITPRELQVLRCIADGLTTRQTATRLGLSERTVESHIAKLYGKLGARTRIQAAVQATRLGLLETGVERERREGRTRLEGPQKEGGHEVE